MSFLSESETKAITQKVLSFARRAEDLGFDGVFAFDHFFPPGAPSDRPSLEAFTTLAAVAASTKSWSEYGPGGFGLTPAPRRSGTATWKSRP